MQAIKPTKLLGYLVQELNKPMNFLPYSPSLIFLWQDTRPRLSNFNIHFLQFISAPPNWATEHGVLLSARIGIVQPFTLFGSLLYILACTAKSVSVLHSVLNKPHFIHRQQSIHVSQVRKKVVAATMMESSGSHRVAKWQGLPASISINLLPR